jgi:hypothetical protein
MQQYEKRDYTYGKTSGDLQISTPCSLGLSATLTTNQPPATSQQYSSLRTNQHQPPANRTGCKYELVNEVVQVEHLKLLGQADKQSYQDQDCFLACLKHHEFMIEGRSNPFYTRELKIGGQIGVT